MVDAKVLYIIFGHSGWTSLKKPYVWCECDKGDSVNTGHICQLLTNEKWSNQEWLNREKRTQARSIIGLGP